VRGLRHEREAIKKMDHARNDQVVRNNRDGCHSTSPLLDGLGREEATFLSLQDEMTLACHFFGGKPIKKHWRKERTTSKIFVVQDVKWGTHTEASDYIWKHQGTLHKVSEAGRLK
jgi:hypothetical protein